MRILLFILIELLLYPLTLLGLVLFMGVILLVNRPRGISGTAYEPLMNRLLYDQLGTRPDPVAARLAGKLPATTPLVWWLLMGPTRLAARISGFRPTMFDFPAPAARPAPLMSLMVIRTAFFDETLSRALEQVGQVVILGAGWDTRAYGIPEDWAGTVFEVDTQPTQAAKRRALDAAGIDTAGVRFVPVDFNQTTWLDALRQQGFDPQVPTCVLLEGVTMYLEAHAIDETLSAVSRLAPGSHIACDYFAAELLLAEPPFRLLGRLLPLGMWLTYGEKLRCGIPMGADARGDAELFFSDRGLALEDFDQVGGWCGFALARVPTPGN